MGLIKAKQYHYWNEKKDIRPWHKISKDNKIIFLCNGFLDLKFRFSNHSDWNREELMDEAVDIIMCDPWEVDRFCDCVRKISRYICVRVSSENNINQNNVVEDDLSSEESEWAW